MSDSQSVCAFYGKGRGLALIADLVFIFLFFRGGAVCYLDVDEMHGQGELVGVQQAVLVNIGKPPHLHIPA